MRATVHVFTFKEGLLARLAHDLRLSVGTFEIRLARGEVDAWFDVDSIEVDGVARGDRIDRDALSQLDKNKIRDTLRRELLHSAEHPRVEVQGKLKREAASYAVQAEVRLRGRTCPLLVSVQLKADRAAAKVEFSPSQFGITPYKAVGGAIRLQDRVIVQIELLEEAAKLEALSVTGEVCEFGPA
jgi:hypothetical protein